MFSGAMYLAQHLYGGPGSSKGGGKDEGAVAVGTKGEMTVESLLRTQTTKMVFDARSPKVHVEDLPVPGGAWLLRNLLNAEECKRLIDVAEEMGFEEAPLRHLDITNSEKFRRATMIRKAGRVLCDIDDDVATELNARAFDSLPRILTLDNEEWELVPQGEGKSGGCLNRRYRFGKYDKGDYFRPHFDAGYVYSSEEKTLLTFILYLSEGFEGGETTFFPGNKQASWKPPVPGSEFKVVPKIGSCLVFWQTGRLNPRHEGSEMLSGGPNYKYILRTDVAYRLKKQ